MTLFGALSILGIGLALIGAGITEVERKTQQA